MYYDAILFDLDGTLVDSAPDLVQTLNDLLVKFARKPVSLEKVRPFVSQGSKKLLEIGFSNDYPLEFNQLRQLYLDTYQQQKTNKISLFAGVTELLQTIEDSKTPWAIVTNKPTRPTIPITKYLGFYSRTSAIVCGDTLPVAKPDPSPIILACEMMGVSPYRCVYIGDCDHDITAGASAGMQTIACEYGYIAADNSITDWGADAIVKNPLDIIPLIQKGCHPE